MLLPSEVSEDLFHEVATLFPPMEEEEFQAFVADVARRGLLEPIWIFQGKIIDGIHRYRACQLLGIVPVYREWDGNGSLIDFVVAQNLLRRHLTATQKAVLAVELERQLQQEARRNQSLAGGDKRPLSAKMPKAVITPFHTREVAAARVGTGPRYLSEAKKIIKMAPELQQKMKRGEVSMADAKLLAPLSADQRAQALQAKAEGRVKTIKAAILDQKKAAIQAQAQAEPEKPLVTCASWEDWLPDQPPCDLLLTDPPYASHVKDIEAFAQAWLPLALSKVKATGRAYVCIGASPRELRAYLNVQTRWPVRQVLVWEYRNTMGPRPTHEYKQNWQALLYFSGPEAPPLDCPLLTEQFTVQEMNAPDGRFGVREHTWQKPDALAELLIRHSTRPGDVIYDLFCGTGTFVLASQRLGRIGRGCDSSLEMLAIAERRGCAIAR